MANWYQSHATHLLDAYWELWHLMGRLDVDPDGAAMLRRIRRHLRREVQDAMP